MTITISVRMSDEEAQALQELVRQTGKTASEMVRESIAGTPFANSWPPCENSWYPGTGGRMVDRGRRLP